MTPIRRAILLCLLFFCALPLTAKTWFVRPDGGNRYDAKEYTPGQCDGKADAPYPGHGTNQHCAFFDVRYMYMVGTPGNVGWVMAGGDTLVIRGCRALSTQQHSDAPHCRIGTDTDRLSNNPDDFWCHGTQTCAIPSPPSGTAAQHTRILGDCAYGTYHCNPVDKYPYTNNNLTQLFGGYGLGVTFYLNGSKYIDVEGIEVTTHNGKCARYGTTHPLPGCVRNPPYSDQSDQGITTDDKTSNILLQDVYVHGFSSNGITGPIGGPITLNRVNVSFNAFAGWNFDDGKPTPNGPHSSVEQHYLTMVGNGCQEEYPITHPQFPAKGCWDSQTGGFGDAWSGQNGDLDSFTCDHCYIAYNTKDGAMGPHTGIKTIALTNSVWIGNMGQSGKWGQGNNTSFLFQNNLMVGNCMRLSEQLPGAAQNFDGHVNLPGSGLGGYCRAAGPLFDYFTGQNSKVRFNNNTIVSYQTTVFEPGCWGNASCSSSPLVFTNNIVLGYTSKFTVAPFNPGQPPSLFYKDDKNVVISASHNIWDGVKDDDGTCGKNGNLCNVDPQFVNQPANLKLAKQTLLDNFNFHPAGTSPALHHGIPVDGLATDYYGTPRPNPPTIGAVEPH